MEGFSNIERMIVHNLDHIVDAERVDEHTIGFSLSKPEKYIEINFDTRKLKCEMKTRYVRGGKEKGCCKDEFLATMKPVLLKALLKNV